jgi:hypothetical protein
VHKVMGHAVPHAAEEDRGAVGPDPAAKVVNAVVDRIVPTRFERLAVTTAQYDPTLACIMDVAGNNAVLRPCVTLEHRVPVEAAFEVLHHAADCYADRADVPQSASGNKVVVAAHYFHPRPPGATQDETTESDMLRASQRDQRCLKQRDPYPALLNWFRRPLQSGTRATERT